MVEQFLISCLAANCVSRVKKPKRCLVVMKVPGDRLMVFLSIMIVDEASRDEYVQDMYEQLRARRIQVKKCFVLTCFHVNSFIGEC